MKKSIFCLIAICLISHYSYGQKKLLKEVPGVVSFTFRDDFNKDVPGTLDKIKAMGITNIEFSNLFGQTPQQLRALLDARGMRCTSLGVGHEALKNDLDKVIATAKALGAEFVRIGSINRSGSSKSLTEEAVKQAVVDFNTLGKKLYENDLTFCYHNHGPEFKPAGTLDDGLFFDYLVKNTDPKYVAFEMDVTWVYWPGEDPVKWLNKYPERFKLMHVKNVKTAMPRGVGATVTTAVGDGQIDMEAVLRAAQKTKIKYYYIEDESNLVDIQVPRSIKYLEALKRK